jgi:hypothetical protein
MATLKPVRWTRHGDTTDSANSYPALATAPTSSAHGILVDPAYCAELGYIGLIYEAVGSCTFTVQLWGYTDTPRITVSDAPVDIDSGTRSTGWHKLMDVSIAVSGVDASSQQRQAHRVLGITGFTRLAAQITGATGAPTVWVDFGFARPDGR